MKKINNNFEKLIIGFSSGIMLASAIWSLIIPSLESSNELILSSEISTALGIVIGITLLFIFNKYCKCNERVINLKRMFNVMTIHNIPEGIVIGLTAALLINNTDLILFSSFISLSIGISIQNIPEGLIVSFPFYINGYSKIKSFGYGFLSGAIEPLFCFITLFLSELFKSILSLSLSIAAGMMIYVVMFELIPDVIDEDKKSNFWGIYGFSLGFIIMLLLDNIL